MAKRKGSSRTKRRKNSRLFEGIHENAAGIDAGAEEHWVAVGEDHAEQPVRKFGTTTTQLYLLADWLVECGITTVAVEATGVYCVPLMEVLEARGVDVLLAKPSSLKWVNDHQKTDYQDCQWIQILHTFALLKGSYRPNQQIATLRAYARHRRMLIEQASHEVSRMQKSLNQMNVRLDQAVSDITGQTGMSIIRAILDGERDPGVLAAMRDTRCAKSEEEIAEALMGHYRDEHLFTLKQSVDLWDIYREMIRECDQKLEAFAGLFEKKADRSTIPPPRRREHVRKNVFSFEARELFYEMLGVDLTQIDGISASTVATFVTEVGTSVDPWKTHKKFGSWLRVSPGSNISGGKRRDSKNRSTTNRLATALRVAAQSLEKSKSALGAFYRRMKARLGPEAAINATAHKLARMIYWSVRDGRVYVDPGPEYYDQRYKERTLKRMQKRAQTLGFQLVPINSTV